MKCPFKEYVHIHKDGLGHIYKTTRWMDCEEGECPYWDYFRQKCRRAENETAKSV